MTSKVIKTVTILVAFCSPIVTNAQDKGVFSGDLQINQNFYIKDTNIILPPAPPQYDKQLASTEGWLNLNYRINDYSFGLRYDIFNNSGLRQPFSAYTDQGVGYWYAKKRIDDLEVTVGYFYEQFGSGIAFRAYEGRGQNLDYAIKGLHLKYYLGNNWTLKGFTGQQKFRFDTYNPVIKGANGEGFVAVSENFTLQPGGSVVNRTLDDDAMSLLVNNINALELEDRFDPKYNVFIYSIYNTFNYKNLSLYAEYSGKTAEAVYNRNGLLVKEPGSVIYGSGTYSQKGLSATLQYKRTEFFEFRTAPTEVLNNGLITYIPPIAMANTYRLTSRYQPATQLIGEQGIMFDFEKKLGNHSIALNYSNINTLESDLAKDGPDSTKLYRELQVYAKIKLSKKIKGTVGIQQVVYNQDIYQTKPGVPLVKTLTPYIDMTFKLKKRRSFRVELSHMDTDEDYGSWAWALLEYNIAPKYSFSIMDMYNYGNKDPDLREHYYTAFAAVNVKRNRFTFAYVKQVEGIICTGGVCRIEPAFSGIRATLTSSF